MGMLTDRSRGVLKTHAMTIARLDHGDFGSIERGRGLQWTSRSVLRLASDRRVSSSAALPSASPVGGWTTCAEIDPRKRAGGSSEEQRAELRVAGGCVAVGGERVGFDLQRGPLRQVFETADERFGLRLRQRRRLQ